MKLFSNQNLKVHTTQNICVYTLKTCPPFCLGHLVDFSIDRTLGKLQFSLVKLDNVSTLNHTRIITSWQNHAEVIFNFPNF